MPKLTKAFVLALALSSTAPTPITTAAQAAPAVASNPLRIEWAQDHSDLKPDPAARFGRLPNGMTYVIYQNATPPGTVSIHLRVGAGSMVEDENQRGLAHFLEHMAFNGSKHIPKDQLEPLLQRHGLKIGPDAEAYTLPNKTEYSLDLPKNDADSVDTALLILREMAGNLLLQPDAIERERKVILGEERLRDTPQVHAQMAWLGAGFAGQKFATRGNPIGLVDVIKTAQRPTIAAYYHAFYRPELATLVVVGDIDPAVMEAKIKAKFGDWKAVGPAKPVDFGAYQTKGLKTLTYAEKTLPPQITASWFQPYDGRPETTDKDLTQIQDAALITILNRRIQHAAQQPQAAFVGGGVGAQPIYQTAKLTQLVVVPKPGQDKAALVQAVGLLKQFVIYGVNPDELDQVLKDFDNGGKTAVAGAKTRENGAIVSSIISNIDGNGVFESPQESYDVFNRLKPQLTVATLNARAKLLLSGDGPLLAHTGEDVSGLDEAALKTTYAEAMAQPVTALNAVATKPWPYTDFGPAQAPVSQQAYKDFGFTRYLFANGLKLNVMPTKFKDDQILVSVNFRGGMESLSPQTTAPVGYAIFYAQAGGIVAGGLGKLDHDELQKSLAGKSVGLTYFLGDDSAGFSATTTKADLATQMQMLMAFTTDAAFRPQLFDRLHAVLPNIYAQISSTPQSVLGTTLPGLARVGDARVLFPTQDQATAATLDQVKAVLEGSLSHAPVEVTIIGDVDPATAVDQVSRTFATLPALPKAPAIAPGGDHATFPAQNLSQTLYHQGRPDQSVSVIAWPTTDNLSNTQTTHGLELLAEVLSARLFHQVRETLGQAYDAHASIDQSWVFKGYGMISATGSVTAGQDAAFVQAVQAIVTDLQTKPITQDELDRARKPLLDRWENDQKDNQHWMYVIPHVAEDTTRAQSELTKQQELLKVTPADIQALAKTYLVSAKALHVVVLPQPKTAGK